MNKIGKIESDLNKFTCETETLSEKTESDIGILEPSFNEMFEGKYFSFKNNIGLAIHYLYQAMVISFLCLSFPLLYITMRLNNKYFYKIENKFNILLLVWVLFSISITCKDFILSIL